MSSLQKPASYSAPKMSLVSALFYLILFAGASNYLKWFSLYGGPQPIVYYAMLLLLAGWVMANRLVKGHPVIPIQVITENRWVALWVYLWVVYLTLQGLRGLALPLGFSEFTSQFEMALVLSALFLLNDAYGSEARRRLFFVLVVVICSALNVYDFLVPTFSKVPGRAAGFFINPNKSGVMITLALVSVVPVVPRRYRMALLGVAAIGVLLTFSRGAWVALLVSTIWMFFAGDLGFQRQRGVVGVLALSAAGLLGLGVITGTLVDLLLATPLAPYFDSNTLARLGMAELGTDSSSEARFDILTFAVDRFLNAPNPLLGYGLGYMRGWDYPIGTHNMYLFYLVDGGLLGLLVYLGFLGCALIGKSARGVLVILNIAFFSLFSHNLFHAIDAFLFIVLTNSKYFIRDAPTR